MIETSTRISQLVPERLWSEVTEASILFIYDIAYIIVGFIIAIKLYNQRK